MLLPSEGSERFNQLIEYVETMNTLNQGSGTALFVIQHDKIVVEHYSGYHSQLSTSFPIQADSQFNVASVRKSYIGMAVALAVCEGKIKSIDDQVTDYLPGLDPAILGGTTIRHLLTHTHGLDVDREGNIIREFIPGSSWSYRNINIELLTGLVRTVTGCTVAEILSKYVFNPLGFTETGWRAKQDERLVQVIEDPIKPPVWKLGLNEDGDGDQKNLHVSARELAYWGYLHLKKGNINGKQLIPMEAVEMATNRQSPSFPNPDLPLNGFLWFIQDGQSKLNEIGPSVPQGAFQILGVTGPLLLVIPSHELVVVRMYNKLYNYSDKTRDYLYYLREFGDKVMECVESKGSNT
ncbi:serine hydrolase domain-containing protein [Brevibacillus borstelensis]|uniref:serine hydrolase domain-containing protein n=1 Tax=Brevibacillus borstelensis TaxID=45462 RepID=UPI0030BC527C